MNRQINIEEVRNFLAVSNKQFEQGGIKLHHVKFVRDERTGSLTNILLRYESEETQEKKDE